MLTLSRFEGKTLEEATEKCLEELNVTEEQIYLKKSETEAKLFKSKKIIIEVIKKQDIINYIKEYIKELDKSFNIEIKSEVNENEGIIKVVLVSNNNPILIGKDGKNIEAIQALLRNSIRNQIGIDIKVNVDASNYKKKKEENFEREIKKILKEVEKTHMETKLDPMNSYKRRIVHNLASKFNNIKTESVGEEPNRYTIIKYEED
ncbi:MAG: protein jag [Bacilli bacterium]